MKKVLVTGGAGFLGSHLCERLFTDRHDEDGLAQATCGKSDATYALVLSPHF